MTQHRFVWYMTYYSISSPPQVIEDSVKKPRLKIKIYSLSDLCWCEVTRIRDKMTDQIKDQTLTKTKILQIELSDTNLDEVLVDPFCEGFLLHPVPLI